LIIIIIIMSIKYDHQAFEEGLSVLPSIIIGLCVLQQQIIKLSF